MGKKAIISVLVGLVLATTVAQAAATEKKYNFDKRKMIEEPGSVAPVGTQHQVGAASPATPIVPSGGALAAGSSEYTAEVNDVLSVAVIQPDPFSLELTISPDGRINFPYIGTIAVRGLTMAQIQETITTGLAEYMKYPVVAVSLKASHGHQFFVFGEVTRPGAYPLEKDTTVLKAITTAGGFTRVASTANVRLLRQNGDGTTKNMTLDINALMTGKTSKDEKVEPGDVITISQRFF